jgi:hypothetical protein
MGRIVVFGLHLQQLSVYMPKQRKVRRSYERALLAELGWSTAASI